MVYCEEYKNWVDSTVESSFSIQESSAYMRPGDTDDDAKCDGLGFIGLYKRDDGQLMFKFPDDSELGYELVTYSTIFSKYNKQ